MNYDHVLADHGIPGVVALTCAIIQVHGETDDVAVAHALDMFRIIHQKVGREIERSKAQAQLASAYQEKDAGHPASHGQLDQQGHFQSGEPDGNRSERKQLFGAAGPNPDLQVSQSMTESDPSWPLKRFETARGRGQPKTEEWRQFQTRDPAQAEADPRQAQRQEERQRQEELQKEKKEAEMATRPKTDKDRPQAETVEQTKSEAEKKTSRAGTERTERELLGAPGPAKIA